MIDTILELHIAEVQDVAVAISIITEGDVVEAEAAVEDVEEADEAEVDGTVPTIYLKTFLTTSLCNNDQ